MSTDLQKQAEMRIDEAVADFLDMINSVTENGYYRKFQREQPTFEILKPANDELYEYTYFESVLEWCSREFLINRSLINLFDLFKIDYEPLPEKELKYISVRFDTESIENIYPFEFIILKEGKRIGYRYTSLCQNEVCDLLNGYQLVSIVHIDWSKENNYHRFDDCNYESISVKEFLEEYFPSLDCNLIIEKFQKAVEDANKEIGLETIPRLSLRNLSNFKQVTGSMLASKNYRNMRFFMLPNSDNKKGLNNISLNKEDYKICDEYFINNGLYKALLGNEGFAKCFITAEYQYSVFKQGNSFDYTSVVCGYLKSIEQLIYKLLKINLDNPADDKLWIKNGKYIPEEIKRDGETTRNNPFTGKLQVVFDKEFEEYFDTSLKPMIWFLHDNKNGWKLSDDGRKKICKLLLSFSSSCRNDHFHKDNIDDYKIVDGIRDNTILLMYLLIGGYKMSGSIDKDKALLGIQSDTFDSLYKKLQEFPRGIYKFIIQFSGENEIKAYKYYHQEKTEYNDSGSVINSRIKFIKIDTFSRKNCVKAMNGALADNEFFIDKDHIPEYIAYIEPGEEGKEVSISF